MNATRLTIWIVAAAATVGLTTAAVTVANAGSGPDDVLSQDDVSRELAGETPPPTSPDPPSEPLPAASDPVTIERPAGRLVVVCYGHKIRLVSWSPNPGYRVDRTLRGPAPTASVWFESDTFDDVEVLMYCDGEGFTYARDLVLQDDHGGDRDDGDDDDGDRSGSNSGDG